MAIPFDPNNPNNRRPGQQRTGTGFTNIGKYMQANRPGQLGQALQTRVGGTVEKSQAELDKQRKEFEDASKGAALGTEQQRQQVTSAIQDPTKATEEQQKLFEQSRAGYQGPQGLSNTAALQAQQAQLGAIGRATQSAGGRQALLQRYIGGPQYSQGQQRLDTMLLGGAASNLRSVGREAQRAQQALGQGQEQAALQGQQLGAQAEQFKQDVAGQVEAAQKGVLTGLGEKATAATQEAQANRALLEKVLSGRGGLTEDESKKAEQLFYQMGMSPDTALYGTLQNTPLTRYLGDVKQASLAQMAAENPEQRARFEALTRLSGGKAPGEIGAETGKYERLGTLDKGTLQTDIQAKKSELETSIARDPIASQIVPRQQTLEQLNKDIGKMSPIEIQSKYGQYLQSYGLPSIASYTDMSDQDAANFKQAALAAAQKGVQHSQARSDELEKAGGKFQTIRSLMGSYYNMPQNPEAGKGYIF